MYLPQVIFRLPRLQVILLTIFLNSCNNSSKLVYKLHDSETKVKFFVSNNLKPTKGRSSFYVRVDSNNVRVYYSFFSHNIYKTFDKSDNLIYTLVSDQKPMLQFSAIDSLVFGKADNLMDSLGLNNLKRTKGATGFVVEVSGH